jgi:hypothetical protein
MNEDAMRLESIGSLDETATGRFNPTHSSEDLDTSSSSSSSSSTAEIARESELFSGQADVFAFERCVSRLVEMSTEEYANLSHIMDSNHNCASSDGTGFSTLPEAPPQIEEEEKDKEDEKDQEAQLEVLTLRESRRKNRIRQSEIESELFSQIRQRGYEEQKMIDAPRFSDRHFWGLGKWNPKRGGEWSKGPRMSGPNPMLMIWKTRLLRVLGIGSKD